jgi:hypothetical protein
MVRFTNFYVESVGKVIFLKFAVNKSNRYECRYNLLCILVELLLSKLSNKLDVKKFSHK